MEVRRIPKPLLGVRGLAESRAIRAGVLGVVVALVVGLVWLGFVRYQAEARALQVESEVPQDMGVAVASAGGPATALPVPSEAPAPAPPVEIFVHVAGAVGKSGVYRLPKGARVADALAAAGGPAADGVQDALNLAEELQDGQKILVPTKKELESAPPVTFTAPSGTSQGAASKPAAPTKVNVNTGTVAQFDALPGVSPTVAKNIVDYRTKYGPFKKLEDLDKVSGIGPATLEKLRPYLAF